MLSDGEIAGKVKVLSDGTFTLDGGMFVYGVPKFYGMPIKAKLKPLYIETGDERIIVDTGVGDLPEKWTKMYGVEKETSLLDELKTMGISPEDVTMVINTHLHFDHTGYNKAFTNAVTVADEEEIRYANYPDRFQAGAYLRSNLEGLKFKGVSGEKIVAPGVTVIPTPGHTPGHMSVIVELEDEVMIYTGDVSPLRINHEKTLIPGVIYDPVAALDSIEILHDLSSWWPEKRKTFIYSHE